MIARSRDCVDFPPLRDRDLGNDMRRSPKAVESQNVRVARHAKRSVADQSGAEQRRKPIGFSVLREGEAVAGFGDGVIGVPALDLVAGKARVIAEIFASGMAKTAVAARMPKPGNADPLPDLQVANILAERRDPSHDFMAGNDRQIRFGQFAVDHVQVRPADTACLNGNQNLVPPWRRDGQLLQAQRLTGMPEHHGLHAVASESVGALSTARSARLVCATYLRVIA